MAKNLGVDDILDILANDPVPRKARPLVEPANQPMIAKNQSYTSDKLAAAPGGLTTITFKKEQP